MCFSRQGPHRPMPREIASVAWSFASLAIRRTGCGGRPQVNRMLLECVIRWPAFCKMKHLCSHIKFGTSIINYNSADPRCLISFVNPTEFLIIVPCTSCCKRAPKWVVKWRCSFFGAARCQNKKDGISKRGEIHVSP